MGEYTAPRSRSTSQNVAAARGVQSACVARPLAAAAPPAAAATSSAVRSCLAMARHHGAGAMASNQKAAAPAAATTQPAVQPTDSSPRSNSLTVHSEKRATATSWTPSHGSHRRPADSRASLRAIAVSRGLTSSRRAATKARPPLSSIGAPPSSRAHPWARTARSPASKRIVRPSTSATSRTIRAPPRSSSSGGRGCSSGALVAFTVCPRAV